MSEDWAAVAQAISQRMAELGLNQRELIERSQVSKATVGELYHNSASGGGARGRWKRCRWHLSGTRGIWMRY